MLHRRCSFQRCSRCTLRKPWPGGRTCLSRNFHTRKRQARRIGLPRKLSRMMISGLHCTIQVCNQGTRTNPQREHTCQPHSQNTTKLRTGTTVLLNKLDTHLRSWPRSGCYIFLPRSHCTTQRAGLRRTCPPRRSRNFRSSPAPRRYPIHTGSTLPALELQFRFLKLSHHGSLPRTRRPGNHQQ